MITRTSTYRITTLITHQYSATKPIPDGEKDRYARLVVGQSPNWYKKLYTPETPDTREVSEGSRNAATATEAMRIMIAR